MSRKFVGYSLFVRFRRRQASSLSHFSSSFSQFAVRLQTNKRVRWNRDVAYGPVDSSSKFARMRSSSSWCNSRASPRNVITVMSLIQAKRRRLKCRDASVRTVLSCERRTFRALSRDGRSKRRWFNGLRFLTFSARITTIR